MIIAPSILSLKKEERLDKVKKFLQEGIMYLHLDIMDGKFVPNTTEGVSLAKEFKDFSMVKEAHLMVEKPEEVLKDYVKNGCDYITFHYEAVDDCKELIDYIHSLGVRVGISIKPKTNTDVLKPYLKDLDLILIMSVEPGFGGQKFMPESLEKVKQLDMLRKEYNFDYLIEVDGGINLDNAPLLKEAGSNIVVMGTFLCNATDSYSIIKAVDEL